MANVSVICKKMSNTKLKLSDLNPHLMCVLCGGYYIDATTIVECLHSFCRSCIVKHLECSKYCPICEVQVHKTKPLINIRPDKTLQDIVYKLVPGLFANEMRNRRKFYKERPHYIKPHDSESSGEVSGERKIYINDENITFSLVYHEGPGPTNVDDSYREFSPPAQNERRYFKCPTGVTIHHLKKLLKAKYELSDNNYKLEIYFRDQELHQDFTLLDVAYIYLWKAKGTLDLTYKIFENVVKRQKILDKPENEITETPNEVEISTVEREATETINKEETVEEEEEGKIKKVEKEEKEDKNEKKTEMSETKNLQSEVVSMNQELKGPNPMKPEPTKENGVTEAEVKEVQLQISESGVMSVSQVENSQVVRTVEETVTKVTNSQVVTSVPVKEIKTDNAENGEVKLLEKKPATKPATKPAAKPAVKPAVKPAAKPAPKTSANPAAKPAATPAAKPATPAAKPAATPAAKPATTPAAKPATTPAAKPATTPAAKPATTPAANPATTPAAKPAANSAAKPAANPAAKPTAKPAPKPAAKPAGKSGGKPAKPYKTIRFCPKAWHPVIPKEKLRPTLMKNSDEPRKPPKFFKMRNMSRCLSSPSSEVKPVLTETAEKPEEKKPETGKTLNKIVKIDPKTLRPIEKEEIKISSTPSAPNLLTNPFIPNNNHFLFSDLHLLPPNSGNYKEKPATAGIFKAPIPNGSYPPICFPTPEHSPPGFYPFNNLTKPQTFSFPSGDKMDPLLRASRLSPFGNLTGFNAAGFHASLPPSISRLLNPHHHFQKISQTLEKKNKDESTKETIKRCDDSLKISRSKEEEEEKEKLVIDGNGKEETTTVTTMTTTTPTTTATTSTTTTTMTGSLTKKGEEEKETKEGEQKINGETSESASDLKLDSSSSIEEKEKDKDR